MSDVFTPAERSAVMRAVKARDTAPERTVRKLAWALRPGYRLDARDVPGRPDLVWRQSKRAVFVHGCFWHGHDCARGARAPKANAAYWSAKIAKNRARDARTQKALRDTGWRALVIWECDLRDTTHVRDRLASFLAG